MRRWWDRIFFVLIIAVAAGAIYAVWPDEPDRYFPDWMNLPSGRGLPGTIAGVDLPCHSEDVNEDNPARNCKGMILGLDLQGGSRFVLQAVLDKSDVDVDQALDAAKEIIESRINPFGVSESQVQRSGDDRLIVELPGVSSGTAEDIIRPAVLMFCEPLQQGAVPGQIQGPAGTQIAASQEAAQVYYKPGTCEPEIDAETGEVARRGPDGQIARDAEGNIERITPAYTLYDASVPPDSIIWTPALGTLNGAPTIMTGSFLESNTDVVFTAFGAPILSFNMTNDGERVMGSLSERMQGLPLASFLDGDPIRGEDGAIIAPVIQSQIVESGQTTGLSLGDAKRLRTLLNNGAFPVPLKVIQQQDVDATLGDEAVRHSVQAGIVALLLVMAFMVLYYRLPGVLASLALVVYTAVVLAIFKIGIPGSGPVTLTLAGIAAFVLSVGMAVDANILIFERMKEELRNGRSLIPSIEAGFERAWSSIRDSNIATLITCGILYWMGSQFASALIKGFALTLAIGVIISLFSAITVTRTFLRMAMGSPLSRALWLWTDDRPEEVRKAARQRAEMVPAEAADA
jgi:preprotein translocase subunit SecD